MSLAIKPSYAGYMLTRMVSFLKSYFTGLTSDPRHVQIFILSTLCFLNHVINPFSRVFVHLVTLIPVALIIGILLIQVFPEYDKNRIKSLLITTLSLSVLTSVNSLWMLPIALSIAAGSKLLFRVNQQHFFNPANFAIVVLLMFGQGEIWINHYQWTSGTAGIVGFSIMGALLVTKCSRLGLLLTFIITAILFESIRSWLVYEPLEIVFHQFSRLSFVIFAFFMITDPRSTPNHPYARTIFSIVLVSLGMFFKYFFFTADHWFYALFVTSLLTPVLNYHFKKEQFCWKTAR